MFARFTGGKGLSATTPEAEKTKHQKYVEKIEMLLPWGLEQRVAACLILFKVPLIVIVFFIGLAAELVVKANTLETWSRRGSLFPGGATSCQTHFMKATLTANLGDFGIVEAINASLLMGGVNTTALFEHNLTFDPLAGLAGQQDTCTIYVKEALPNATEFECDQRGGSPSGVIWGGINHLLPFAVLWVICKVLYIGIHPVDRLVKLIKSGETPPEPVFKLLTEPYFQVCTFPMFVIMKAFHFLQYRIMPNALLAALASLQAHPLCPRWLLYRFDWLWSSLCYYMVAADLVLVAVAYVLFSTVAQGQLIGTTKYRCYKFFWFMKSIFICTWPIIALFYTFGGIKALIEAIRGFIRIVISLDFRFEITVDALRIFVIIVLIMESLEFIIMILNIICPRLLGVLPCCAALRDIEKDSDGDGYSDAGSEAGSEAGEVAPLRRPANGGPPQGGDTQGSAKGTSLKDRIIGHCHKGEPKMPMMKRWRLPGRG